MFYHDIPHTCTPNAGAFALNKQEDINLKNLVDLKTSAIQFTVGSKFCFIPPCCLRSPHPDLPKPSHAISALTATLPAALLPTAATTIFPSAFELGATTTTHAATAASNYCWPCIS
eukprot:1160637-Pelagomonas_calceolata.AAC.4